MPEKEPEYKRNYSLYAMDIPQVISDLPLELQIFSTAPIPTIEQEVVFPAQIRNAPFAVITVPESLQEQDSIGKQIEQFGTINTTTVVQQGRISPEQQDSATVYEAYVEQDGEKYSEVVAVVADGVGGGAFGKLASYILKKHFPPLFEYLRNAGLSQEDALAEGLNFINRDIVILRNMLGENQVGATCCVSVMDADGNVLVANVGDTRAFKVGRTSIRQITEDHSQVGQLYKNGQLTELDLLGHSDRNLITQAIGNDTIQIDIYRDRIKKGERLLVCSDGLWEMTVVRESGKVISEGGNSVLGFYASTYQYPDIEDAADHLLEVALAAGGADNIGFVLLELEKDPDELIEEAVTSATSFEALREVIIQYHEEIGGELADSLELVLEVALEKEDYESLPEAYGFRTKVQELVEEHGQLSQNTQTQLLVYHNKTIRLCEFSQILEDGKIQVLIPQQNEWEVIDVPIRNIFVIPLQYAAINSIDRRISLEILEQVAKARGGVRMRAQDGEDFVHPDEIGETIQERIAFLIDSLKPYHKDIVAKRNRTLPTKYRYYIVDKLAQYENDEDKHLLEEFNNVILEFVINRYRELTRNKK